MPLGSNGDEHMGPSILLHRTALAWPGVSVPLLRFLLHLEWDVPERFEWLVEVLKRELPLQWERRTVSLDKHLRIHIDSRSAVGREIYYRGSYEPDLCRLLEQHLRPGMICIDAGANIGEFTLRASRLVGAAGQVHAFEASPTTFAELEANVRLNSLTNVILHQKALTSRSGALDFYLSGGIASGSSSLRPAHDFTGSVVTVQGVTLDDYLRDAGINQVDFIKLDIEGAELDALRGSRRLLSILPAPMLVFEHHETVARKFGASRDSIDHLLGSLGYRLLRVGSSAGARKVGDENVPENFLAVPPSMR